MNPLVPLFSSLADFHFLRPEWFYALIPVVLLFLLLKTRQASSSNWSSAVDSVLLPYLIERSEQTVKRNPFYLLLAGWILATLALAGPVWEKTPQPVHSKDDALVIVLDLSFSMYSIDITPNRLTRARQKLIDILNQREEGVTGLIVYAGDAHVVSPLTDDANTIASMVPALAPEIMPIYGSALAPALELALGMFKDGNVSHGRILVIADDIPDMASTQTIAQANRDHFPVSLLSIGTAQGAPIMLPEQGSLKDSRGVIVIPGVDFAAFQDFADSIGGRYAGMSVSDADLNYLLQETPGIAEQQFRQVERDFDVWQEEGPWLVLLLLPLAAMAFRRGWLWCLLLVMLFPGQDTFAEEAGSADLAPDAVTSSTNPLGSNTIGQFWQDLWQTRDQQAMDALRQGDAQAAARLFNEPAWKGAAHYQGGGYPQAAETFRNLAGAESQYNLGNALARQNKLQEAIDAYDKALEMDSDNEDAKANKELIEKLLEQQQQQEQQQQGEDQQQNKENTQSDKNQQGDQQQGENQQSDSNPQQDNGQQDQQQQSPEQQQSAEQQNKDQEGQEDEQEQQQAEADEEQQQAEDAAQAQQQAQAEDQQIDQEAEQALEQWLRRVPDDPGGLLRRKFEYQAQQRQQQGQGKFKDRDAVW